MRHKVRQLWFDINKQLAVKNNETSDAASNSPEEETKQDLTEQQQSELEAKRKAWRENV